MAKQRTSASLAHGSKKTVIRSEEFELVRAD